MQSTHPLFITHPLLSSPLLSSHLISSHLLTSPHVSAHWIQYTYKNKMKMKISLYFSDWKANAPRHAYFWSLQMRTDPQNAAYLQICRCKEMTTNWKTVTKGYLLLPNHSISKQEKPSQTQKKHLATTLRISSALSSLFSLIISQINNAGFLLLISSPSREPDKISSRTFNFKNGRAYTGAPEQIG